MELNEIMQDSIEIMEKKFYADPFKFSYSSLKKLLWNPQAFYQMYVLGNREEKTESYLVNGKIIHALLLEPDKFDQKFIISPTNLPTGSVRTVIDRVFAHAQELQTNGDQRKEFVDFSNAVLDVLKDINLHQSLKTDQQRIDKMYTPEAMNYWEFIKTKGSRILIDQETYDFCKLAIEIIKTNKEVCDLIKIIYDELLNIEVFNEIELECGIEGKPYGLKGIVDNLVIDHDKKIVYINDIKTTSKELKNFAESVEFYDYWLQAAIYATLVAVKYQELFAKGYELKSNFVVINKLYQVYAFPVSQATIDNWFIRMNDVLEKAHWHYTNKSFDLPYEFATGKVML